MEKMKSSLTNMVMILVGFALIIAALLAWVNHLTEGPIAAKAEKTLADGIKTVMGAKSLQVTGNDTVRQTIDDKEAVFVVHETADKSGKPLGAAVESTSLGFGGDLKVLVGFAPDGSILGYTILQHSETPGLGAKAQTWFQKGGKGNIIGMNPSQGDLTVSKDGGEVDAITASTITSRAFLNAINQAYTAYVKQNQLSQQAVTQK
ncbi:MAG: RnfABCDGE type electron transport complex subunit G [Prevotella sp.]|nr:RnfABCDGE type electron transport complex subunit G [Prevotella sp.]